MDVLVAPNQTAFIKEIFMLKVLSLHMTCCIHPSMVVRERAVLKLEYEKAFHRVDLDFIDDLLLKRGFGPNLRKYIKLATS